MKHMTYHLERSKTALGVMDDHRVFYVRLVWYNHKPTRRTMERSSWSSPAPQTSSILQTHEGSQAANISTLK
jgi:hypothetical protein